MEIEKSPVVKKRRYRKLNDIQIEYIRNKQDYYGVVTELAKELNVSKSMISQIRCGKKHANPLS